VRRFFLGLLFFAHVLIAAHAPARSDTFEILEGFDLPQNDILTPLVDSSLKGISLERCKARCIANAQCSAFTFDTINRWCFLKRVVGDRTKLDYATSGIRIGTASWLAEHRSQPEVYEEKYALVIGNGAYSAGGLVNPANDATDIAEVLGGLGFRVQLHTDVDLAAMHRALAKFENWVPEDAPVVFYFAGHGVQFEGRNHLIPIDAIAKIVTASDLLDQTVSLDELLSRLQTKTRTATIVILDACRNSPFQETLGVKAGLSRGAIHLRGALNAGSSAVRSVKIDGAIVAYSTSPNATAEDGEGRNSPYTLHLKRLLRTPNAAIEDILRQTRAAVAEETDGYQVPWYESSLSEEFHPGLKDSIEFKQLMRLFIPEDLQTASTLDDYYKSGWFAGSGKNSPIIWSQQGITEVTDEDRLRDFDHKPVKVSDVRAGEVIITQRGKPTHYDLTTRIEPMKWDIVFASEYVRRYPTLIWLFSNMRGSSFDGFDHNPSFMVEEVECRRGIFEVPNSSRVFRIELPGHHPAWLGEFFSGGGSGGNWYNYLLVLDEQKKNLLGCS
jgi:hypothetical protein